MNNNSEVSKKQSWGPFLKQVLGPNVPWLWFILNLAIQLLTANLFIRAPELAGRIMGGEIFDNALLWEYVALTAGSLLLGIALAISDAFAQAHTERNIQSRLWNKMLHMPMRLYDRQGPSSLISRMTNDTTLITYSLLYIFQLVSFTYALYLMLKIVFGIHRTIGLALLLVIPYILAVMLIPGRFYFRTKEAVQAKLAKYTTFVAERLASITLVKSAANENADLQLGYEVADENYKAEMHYNVLAAIVDPFNQSMNMIVRSVILIIGSILVNRGEMGMDSLLTVFMYSQMLGIYFMQYIFCFQNLKMAQGSTDKIAEIMSSEPEVLEREKTFTQVDSDIAFENVTFRYEDQDVLKNVSLTIPKGKITAIVGPSGAGKTTMLSLLERLYIPNGGQLKFGDTPAEKIHLGEWRDATGYIQQNSPLLSGTIRDNIVYGINGPVTDAEVFDAAKKANAYDFIMKLPDGFDSDIGQLGGKLSGGERQRIAIARMIIKQPDYLLLDEATSSLDAENEAEVQAALTGVMAGRTAVVVAHNLRTVVNADQIVVMDQGKVQAVGTHESLYKTNKLYKKYFDLQFAE